MTLMSRKVDYALLILAYLDRKAAGGCAREIADRYKLDKGFVANILKDLRHKGFVISHRGVKGGYVLLRSAEDINLAELMEALDDGFHLAECNKAADPCILASLCPVKGAIAEVHHRIREVLRGVTLAELIRPATEGPRHGLALELLPLETQLVGH
jgi:Rrf2 family protein